MKLLKNWQVKWSLMTSTGDISFQYHDDTSFNATNINVEGMEMLLKVLSCGNEWYFDESLMVVSSSKR